MWLSESFNPSESACRPIRCWVLKPQCASAACRAGQLESGGDKSPGLIVPLAVLAATANPIGLIVMGTAKVEGEMTGRTKIEGAAKRTAEAIGKELRIRFKEEGLIK
jgi:hypothetical protein